MKLAKVEKTLMKFIFMNEYLKLIVSRAKKLNESFFLNSTKRFY